MSVVSSRGLGKKGLAFFVALSFAISLVGVVGPLADSAQANHPAGSFLDCQPETGTSPTGSTHTVTCTLVDSAGTAVNVTSSSVVIRAEIDCTDGDCANAAYTGLTNPNAQETGVNGNQTAATTDDVRTTPEDSCTIPQGSSSCQFSYSRTDAGTDEIIAWIDEDSTVGTDDSDGAEVQGDPERDDGTDVMTRTWATPVATVLDCDDATGDDDETNPVDGSELYTCTVTDQFGNPLSGQRVDAEIAGPNDLDGTTVGFTGPSPSTVDVDDTDGTTDGFGQVTYTFNPAGDANVGTDEICFWVDTGNDNVFEWSAGADEDGDDCNEEAPVTEDSDITDLVSKTWEAREAATIDCIPDTDTNPVSTQHSITCNVDDQFGANLNGVEVDAEFISGPSDTDGGSTNPVDFNDFSTSGSGNVTFTWTSATTGTDRLCVWIDDDNDTDVDGNCAEARNDTTDDDTNGATPTEADDPTDVVEKIWTTAQAVRLNCDPEEASNVVPSIHTFECTARDSGNNLINGQVVKVEASGVNDPDAAAPSATPDFTCTTGSSGTGQCEIDHNSAPANNTGITTYRAWVGDAADASEGRDEGATPGATAEPDNTDVVEKKWTGQGTNLVVTPLSDSAAVGACNPFTATLTDGTGNGVGNATLDIRQTDENFGGAAGDESDPNFCTPGAGSGPNPSASGEYDSGNGDGQSAANTSLTTDANGQVTFGVSVMDNANATGLVNLLVWCEDTECTNGVANDTPANNEPQATAQKTWTAGGADAVETVDAEPETDRNPNGTTHTVTATLVNSSGDPVPDVDPNANVTAGPNQGTTLTCGTSDNDGVSLCEYLDPTNTPAGTDTINVWVNQSAGAGGGTTNFDSPGEPNDEVQKEWFTPPTGLRINVTCDDSNGPSGDPTADDDRDEWTIILGGDDSTDCINPLSSNSEVFTALVTNPNGTTTDTDDTPVSGVLVRFNTQQRSPQDIGFNPPGGAATAVECTTDASGRCSVTVTNPTPESGDGVLVGATIVGQQQPGSFGNNRDSAGKQWAAAGQAINLALTPQGATNLTGTSHTVTGTVTDVFNAAVAGANVDFTVSNRNTATSFDKTSDAQGKVTFTYNDAGNVAVDGTDNIFGWVDNQTEDDVFQGGEPSDSAIKHWRVTLPTVNQVKIDMIIGNNTNFPHCPIGVASSDYDAADTNPINTVHELCGVAFDTTNQLVVDGTMAFTLNGPGHFTNAAGTTDLGKSADIPVDQNGDFHAFITSSATGTDTVTATKGGQSATGTKSWTSNPARNIDCTPETGINEPGDEHLVSCLATDREGNPVPGWNVYGSESGPGRFKAAGVQNCSSSNCVVATDGNGVAEYILENTTGDLGNQTATFELAANSNGPVGDRASQNAAVDECERPVDNPAGAPAGNCTDTVQKTWSDQVFDCSDGVDNDGDGLIDFPADPGCASDQDDDETDGGGPIVNKGPCQGFPEGSETPDPAITGRIIVGTQGSDILAGTAGDDIICGLDGNDIIAGGGGDDLIVGNGDDDTIEGNGGKDTIKGGGGDDTVDGNRKNDVVKGGGGNDTLRGNRGFDTVRGGGGKDTLQGGKGDDILRGGSDNDTLKGFTGDDVLNGGKGKDTCKPGKGNDTVKNCEK